MWVIESMPRNLEVPCYDGRFWEWCLKRPIIEHRPSFGSFSTVIYITKIYVASVTLQQVQILGLTLFCAWYGPLHVLWQVSFGCWVTWPISSWQKYYKSFNNWGLNFLQHECSQSSQIYLSPEKLRKTFTFISCKCLNDKIHQNIKFAKLPSAK